MMVFDDLKELAEIQDPCLSVFQPLRDNFSQVTKADTRLTAAAQKADALLAERGFDAAAREEFLRPIFKVAANTDWAGRTGSMIVFRAPGFTKAAFWPDMLDAKVHLGDGFMVLPLIAGLGRQRNAWILALSIKRIHLYRATMQGLSEMALPLELPRSLADAGAFDRPDHDLESRSAPGVSNGQTAAVRSGTGNALETKGQYLHDFFRMIDRAIQPILGGGGDPLILSAVSREVAIYREINTYAGLLDEAISGSPDALGEERLHRKAIELLEANAARTVEQARRDMDRAAGRGLLVTDLAAIEKAAGMGQIDRLFVKEKIRANEERINRAALGVIRNSGKVVCCELGGDSEVAAILRYRLAEAPERELAVSGV